MTAVGELLRLHFTAIETGDPAAARASIHPDHINHMAAEEPAACAQPGPAGLLATSAWLRLAFSDLSFELIEAASDTERTLTHVWMRGRQTGPFVVFPVDATPVAFAPTGRSFAVRQSHVFRLRDGLHAEHIAVRDDLGMLTQLGHLPPSPAGLARMARFALTGNARRAIDRATAVSSEAAASASR